jgi:DNA-binding NarL/FixJ family response regulator
MVTMSPIVADLLATLLAGIAELDVIARLDDRSTAEAELAFLSPDLVFLGLSAGETDEAARRLLARLPQARVVALAHDGRHVYLHEMRPHRTALANVSAEKLVAILQNSLMGLKI